MHILFEDKHMLFIEKPPKVPVQPDPSGDDSLLDQTTRYLEEKGTPRTLRVMNRLDRPVGGAVLFAKTREAAARVSNTIQKRQFFKDYLVVVTGTPENETGRLTDHLKKLPKTSVSEVVSPETRGAKEAILTYKVLETIDHPEEGTLSLLSIRLITGRHHQIRVQLSHAGLPVWGDTKYNPSFQDREGWWQIALWSRKIRCRHPFEKRDVEVQSLPDWETQPWAAFSKTIL